MRQFLVRLFFVLVLALPATTSLANAQARVHPGEDFLIRPSQQFDATRFDSLTAATLRAILDTATAKGLPAGPLVNRALEGAARRVVGSRIIAVVKAHAAAMEDVRRVLGDRTSAPELDACATAMRAGVDGGTMSQLRTARVGTTIIKPCVVLTDIIQRGIPFATANRAVIAISQIPRSDESLDSLQSLVAKNTTRGGQGMAVDAIQRYLRDIVPEKPDVQTGSASRPPDS